MAQVFVAGEQIAPWRIAATSGYGKCANIFVSLKVKATFSFKTLSNSIANIISNEISQALRLHLYTCFIGKSHFL